MAGVDNLVVYTQTFVKYNTFYIHHPGGAKRPRGGVYTTKWPTTAILLFYSRPKPGGGVYLWVPTPCIHHHLNTEPYFRPRALRNRSKWNCWGVVCFKFACGNGQSHSITSKIQRCWDFRLRLPGPQRIGISLELGFIPQLLFSRIKSKFDAMKAFTTFIFAAKKVGCPTFISPMKK